MSKHIDERRTVVVIGAGPSGAIASALVKRNGHDVLVIERQQFPRFSIGESLLSHCLDFIEEAGMLEDVMAAGFQIKHGAAFAWGERYTSFDFRDKFTPGKGSTFQVQRAPFDKLLADCAQKQGVDIRYQETLIDIDTTPAKPLLTVARADGSQYVIEAGFVLDASGYGRVLPRLLDLETPSSLPPRQAVFTHIEDHIEAPGFEREKILITVHPQQNDIWFWLIPFSNGRCSIGVVGRTEYFEDAGSNLTQVLQAFIAQTPSLNHLLGKTVWDTPARLLSGYSANVRALFGRNYALLGNAAEFLDPVFSSGVTIAMHSASLAAKALNKQLNGEAVDWQTEFATPLQVGIDTFRTYVEGWYEGSFQTVVFHENPDATIKQMVCAILAGYAWDQNNPFVQSPKKRLATLAQLCTQ